MKRGVCLSILATVGLIAGPLPAAAKTQAFKAELHDNLACPPGFQPDPSIVAVARERTARQGRGGVEIVIDPRAAATGADVISTDVWASMGEESEAADRRRIFAPFQVNADLMAAADPNALFMHCLPAHRGEEVTSEVIDSPASVVFDQAENRLHTQKALLAMLVG